jgi:NTE family protein
MKIMQVTGPEQINLIMAGGGVRFPAYVGALAAFEEMGVDILNIAGASAGSIVGAFLAAGCPAKEIYRKVLQTDFRRFKDFSLRGLLFEGGVYSGDSLEQWVDAELQHATFADLPHNLYVAAVDLHSREPFFFSKQATPDVHVSKAVRCSMSIPWIWSAQRWDQRLLVDGQLLPWIHSGIEMLKHGCPSDTRTVMLRITSDNLKHTSFKMRLWPWDFAKILLETMLTALDNQRVAGALWQDTILIQVNNIHTLQLNLSVSDKECLFQCGYDQVRQYFHKQPPDETLPGAA